MFSDMKAFEAKQSLMEKCIREKITGVLENCLQFST
jgi:hypothetical protein